MSEARQVELCSIALMAIGAQPIQGFDEGTWEASVAAKLYPIVRDGALVARPWSWAEMKRTLAPLAEPPVSDYGYRFQLPGDLVRLISVGEADRTTGVEYRLVAFDRIECDRDAVIIKYIARLEEEKFPPEFDLALIARLQAAFMLPVTGDRGAWAEANRLAEVEIARAGGTSAQQSTPKSLKGFPLTDVR